MSGHTLSYVFLFQYVFVLNWEMFLSHMLLIKKYSVYSRLKFAHKKHTHEFQISNIIRVFLHSSVQVVYCILLSPIKWN